MPGSNNATTPKVNAAKVSGAAAWVLIVLFAPVIAIMLSFYGLGYLVSKLDHIDPMPWNQAILLGIAFAVMIAIAVFGNFACV
jgi:hypothetical protein